MSANAQHKAFERKQYIAFAAAKPANAVTPITYGAYSTSRDYGGNNMTPARSNADDNLAIASVFTGPQIKLTHT